LKKSEKKLIWNIFGTGFGTFLEHFTFILTQKLNFKLHDETTPNIYNPLDSG
jgi:hypothetical protein